MHLFTVFVHLFVSLPLIKSNGNFLQNLVQEKYPKNQFVLNSLYPLEGTNFELYFFLFVGIDEYIEQAANSGYYEHQNTKDSLLSIVADTTYNKGWIPTPFHYQKSKRCFSILIYGNALSRKYFTKGEWEDVYKHPNMPGWSLGPTSLNDLPGTLTVFISRPLEQQNTVYLSFPWWKPTTHWHCTFQRSSVVIHLKGNQILKMTKLCLFDKRSHGISKETIYSLMTIQSVLKWNLVQHKETYSTASGNILYFAMHNSFRIIDQETIDFCTNRLHRMREECSNELVGFITLAQVHNYTLLQGNYAKHFGALESMATDDAAWNKIENDQQLFGLIVQFVFDRFRPVHNAHQLYIYNIYDISVSYCTTRKLESASAWVTAVNLELWVLTLAMLLFYSVGFKWISGGGLKTFWREVIDILSLLLRQCPKYQNGLIYMIAICMMLSTFYENLITSLTTVIVPIPPYETVEELLVQGNYEINPAFKNDHFTVNELEDRLSKSGINVDGILHPQPAPHWKGTEENSANCLHLLTEEEFDQVQNKEDFKKVHETTFHRPAFAHQSPLTAYIVPIMRKKIAARNMSLNFRTVDEKLGRVMEAFKICSYGLVWMRSTMTRLYPSGLLDLWDDWRLFAIWRDEQMLPFVKETGRTDPDIINMSKLKIVLYFCSYLQGFAFAILLCECGQFSFGSNARLGKVGKLLKGSAFRFLRCFRPYYFFLKRIKICLAKYWVGLPGKWLGQVRNKRTNAKTVETVENWRKSDMWVFIRTKRLDIDTLHSRESGSSRRREEK